MPLTEIQWLPSRWSRALGASLLYLGVTGLLVRWSNLGSFGLFALIGVTILAAYSLSTTPVGLGISGEGIHLRTLVRGHRIVRWEAMRDVKARPGVIVLTGREGRALRLPDPTGGLARGAETHFRSGTQKGGDPEA